MTRVTAASEHKDRGTMKMPPLVKKSKAESKALAKGRGVVRRLKAVSIEVEKSRPDQRATIVFLVGEGREGLKHCEIKCRELDARAVERRGEFGRHRRD